MSTAADPASVAASLEVRRSDVEAVLASFCENGPLPSLLGGRWAIVGGAVRDAILARSFRTGLLSAVAWPDVDIAVPEPVANLPVMRDSHLRRATRPTLNAFGGLKFRPDGLCTIDTWYWQPISGSDGTLNWERILDSVDYGANAVAFTWPERRVVFHPRWLQDLSAGPVVDVLFADRPRPEIQAMRAIALRERISSHLGRRVELGKRVKQELRWLVVSASTDEVSDAFTYLRRKVSSGRWSLDLVDKIFRAAATVSTTGRFWDLAPKILEMPISAPRNRHHGSSLVVEGAPVENTHPPL